tara:strand:- start:92 stop:1558 length:1467 start_codon:yes stop_codon:yes gene_type:complete
MSFQTIPVQVTGPSYQSRSKPLSSQSTQNWYQQFDEQGKDPYVLLPFPGLRFRGHADGKDRGFHRMSEVLYQVKGASLYSIDKVGAHTLKGSIPGTGRAIMANDGINMFIVADFKVWKYSSDTNLITQVTDSNITGSNSVAFINNQFLYTKGGFTEVSGLAIGPGYTIASNVGDGSTANGLNIIGAESSPDFLLRDYVYDQVIYRFGVRTTEPWYNSGQGNPPIDRLDGRLFTIGLGAINSIAETDKALYWLGDDFAIYRGIGGREERISTDAISNELQKYSDVSDAIGNTFTFEGQNFYQITFPTGNKTFVINEDLGDNGWFELSCGVNSPFQSSKYCGQSIMAAYGKNFVADADNGNIYILDFDTFTNNSMPLQRVRTTQSVNGDLVGAKGKRIQMSCLKIIMESGVGLIDGQGDNPRIMVEYSDDGGRTWNGGSWPKVGRLGEFTLQVEWFDLGSFYDRIFRISTTDPVNYSIYSATIDLRGAGK